MRGLDPRIHLLRQNLSKWMDCRVKPGNDGNEVKSPEEILRGFAVFDVRA
jgi:hypothetical protein